MLAIGELARASGLTVSALRFYDGAGVLVPAEVDASSGYRRYSAGQVRAARLIAGLRRVGMPVSEIAQAVRDLDKPDSVRLRVDHHWDRLEAGLADARRELLRIYTLLDLEENLMTRITLPSAALAATLDAVRFAVGADPELPQLGGVLFETGKDTLTLVATDRYRLAVASTAADVEGPPVRLTLPIDLLDRMPLRAGPITIDLTGEAVRAENGDAVAEGAPMAVEFPDYRRILDGSRGEPRRVTVDVAALREQVSAAAVVTRAHEGTTYPVVALGLDPAGSVRVAAESEWATATAEHVGVQREFLLEALAAGGAGQLVLELDGPIKPLAFRVPGDDSRFSILMPVRHDAIP
jgi:DNA polymerase III subunit beta